MSAAGPARSRPARPLPVHAGQGPRRRDRVGEESAPDARRPTPPRSPGRHQVPARRDADPDRSRSPGSSPGTNGPRTAPVGSTSTTCSSGSIEILETDAGRPPQTVRARKRWFSVDEYQDTNPLQQRLLELWLGDRRDLCVVGDEDQTIYTFTGATSEFLTGFADAVRGALASSSCSRTTAPRRRSSPSPTTCSPRPADPSALVATQPSGPAATVARHGTEAAELAALARWIRERARRGGRRRPRSPCSCASTPSWPRSRPS